MDRLVNIPGVKLVAVVERAGVLHGEHVPVFGLDGAYFWHADHFDFKFGDLLTGERGSG